LKRKEVEVGPVFKSTAEASAEEACIAATVAHISEGKQPVLLQVNCSSICYKILTFWDLNDT
jgi:3-oxoacyl-(acyl-carrier-protein) synthase